MLGWHISVFRQADGGVEPAAFDAAEGAQLAVWQTGLDGLDWITRLVQGGLAVDLQGNGYPHRFTAHAKHLVPQILRGPPQANRRWTLGPHDVIGPGWSGKTVIDRDVAQDCGPDEWLLVEAWDES